MNVDLYDRSMDAPTWIGLSSGRIGPLLRIGIACLIVLGSCASFRCLSADVPLRQWSDASGKFSVNARLVRQSETEVVLKKTDGLTVTVPIGRLSQSDRDYLTAQKTTSVPVGDRSGAKVDLLAIGYQAPMLPGSGKEVYLSDREVPRPITPDPAPPRLTSVPFVRPLEEMRASWSVSVPLAVSPRKFAVSTYRSSRRNHNDGASRVYLVEADDKSPQVVLKLNQAFQFLDHHLASGRTLAVIGSRGILSKGGDLVLMTGFAEGKPVALGRARVSNHEEPNFPAKIVAAKLIRSDVAVVQAERSLYVWSLSSGKLFFTVRNVDANFSVSGSGRYLAIGKPGGAQVIDLVKGEVMQTLVFKGPLTPFVAFSPDGTKLAMQSGTYCRIWDLAKAKVHSEAKLDESMVKLYDWIGNDYLLTHNGLIDAATCNRVWNYRLPSVTHILPLRGTVLFTDRVHVALLACLPIPHRKFAEPGQSILGRGKLEGKWEDSDGGAPPLETIANSLMTPTSASVPAAPSPPLRVQGFDSQASGLELLNSNDSVRELTIQGPEIFFAYSGAATPQTPDPGPPAARFVPYRTFLEDSNPRSDLRTTAPLVIDAEKPIHAASVYRRPGPLDKPFGRVYLAMPKDDGTVTVSPPVINVKERFYLADHHRPSGHTLAMMGKDLVVMKNLASGKPDVIARWHLRDWESPSSPPEAHQLAWVSEEHAVALYGVDLYCWSLASGELRFKIEQEVLTGIAVSGTGRFILAIGQLSCLLVDVAKGEPIGRIELPSMVSPDCHFSPDGRHLAFVFGDQLAIWDLTTAKMVVETTFPGPLGRLVGWVGNGYVLTQAGGLIEFDATTGTASKAWNYYVSSLNKATAMPSGLIGATTIGGVRMFALPIPHRAGILGHAKAALGKRTGIHNGQWSDF